MSGRDSGKDTESRGAAKGKPGLCKPGAPSLFREGSVEGFVAFEDRVEMRKNGRDG